MVLKNNTVISCDNEKVYKKYLECDFRNEYTKSPNGKFLCFECKEHFFILENLYECNNVIYVKKQKKTSFQSAVLDFASVCEKLVTEYNVCGFLLKKGTHDYGFIRRFVGKDCVRQFDDDNIFVWIGDIYNNGKKVSKDIWIDKVNKMCINYTKGENNV